MGKKRNNKNERLYIVWRLKKTVVLKNREDGMKPGKKFMVMAIIFSFILLPLGSTAIVVQHQWHKDKYGIEQVESWDMILDVFATRPVGIVSTIFGTGTFIVSSPFSALGDNLQQSFDELVKKPFLYTFKRPLGIF